MTSHIPKIPALKLFTEVMRLGTIAQAAEQVNITQSAASRMLSNLEQDLGLVLFKRQKQRLIPLSAAETFYPEALRVISVMEELPRISDAIRSDVTVSERLRVLSYPRLAEQILPAAINRFRRESGLDVNISVTVEMRHNVERWAASRMFDLALVSVPIDYPRIRVENIAEFPICVVAPKEHDLAKLKVVEPRHLSGVDVALVERGSLLRETIDRVFRTAGRSLEVKFEAGTENVAMNIANDLRLVSICDGVISDHFPKNGYVLRKLKTKESIPIGFATTEGHVIEGAALELKQALEDRIRAYHADLEARLAAV